MDLKVDTITFGKYKGQALETLLRDRQYCGYLMTQDWFTDSYTYLSSRISAYDPLPSFIGDVSPKGSTLFVDVYPFFRLLPLEEVRSCLPLALTSVEGKCYVWYREAVLSLKTKIQDRLSSGVDDPYNIKTPPKYLQKFEKDTGLIRDDLQAFLSSFDLRNITLIIEDLKKEAGIDFKGAKGFLIARERSMKQEKFWSKILKEMFGDHLSEQFKLENCKFDFINIKTSTVFEAKLGFKDFNEKQYTKYKLILNKFRIVYLIAESTIIDLNNKVIYTTDYGFVIEHQVNIPLNDKATYLDEAIFDFDIEPVSSVEEGLKRL